MVVVDVTDQTKLPLDTAWKARLGLSNRHAPELFETAEDLADALHASAIRTALTELELSAVFCVQGVPTIGILVTEHFDRAKVIELHAALWNQGLISLFLVISDDTIRAFSLARTPVRDQDSDFVARCQIGDVLTATADALRIQNLIYGAESGRLWWDYADYFRPKERIDQVLLDNLVHAHAALRDKDRLGDDALSSDAAQALLIQTMFIAYLEDRDILTPAYFRDISEGQCESFQGVLEGRSIAHLRNLFVALRRDFNGDIFVAPCSFDPAIDAPEIRKGHLGVLAEFRPGKIDLARGQFRFWGYNFRYIPVELISAVYDRFLGEREAERRDKGAYYTPMFLADTVVSQVWDLLDPAAREKGELCDPACGSGIFLVRTFQRLCEHKRASIKGHSISWTDLLVILGRIHGWDVNGNAVRVAVFSLYVALLEEVSPRDIQKLIKRGKILPELWGQTLVEMDFFDAREDAHFALFIGNPPWSSRRDANTNAVAWAKRAKLPMPSNEAAWAFVWKAIRHISPSGIVAFLLPAMGFLHNHAASAVEARTRLFREASVKRVINFSDLRFQLFEKALRPAALFIYGSRPEGAPFERFDYWAPKANLNLRIKRVLTLTSADKMSLSVETLHSNPLVFKQRLWMREPDAKLFNYLDRLPKLGDLITDYRSIGDDEQRRNYSPDWVIGQGYQPFTKGGEVEGTTNSNGDVDRPRESEFVGRLPDLPIKSFRRIFQSAEGLVAASSALVRRRGFERAFKGVRVLVPRGVGTSQPRLRAAFCDQPLTFQDIVQAVSVPAGDETAAKLLTALLNSRLALWFAFHGTASLGADRPEIKQAELLRLPFPEAERLPDFERATAASHQLVSLIDAEVTKARDPFEFDENHGDLFFQIDQLTYDFFCLSDNEIVLIEDTTNNILPAIQPHEGSFPGIWKPANGDVRRSYAEELTRALGAWLKKGETVSARLEAIGSDLGILKLSLGTEIVSYTENGGASLAATLADLSRHIHQRLDGNFQLMPDLRVFVGNDLYLIKPMQSRFWLRSTALADAAAIALDLQDFVRPKAHAE